MTSASDNERKQSLFVEVLEACSRIRYPLQAILFPGGYFFLNKHVGHLSHAERVRAIEDSPVGEACRAGLAKLADTPLRDALLVVGIDTAKKPRRGYPPDKGDQLCVAFNQTGVIGIGRKVFPDGFEREDYVVYADDFTSPHRLVRLADGRKAILCACYDMFGVAESAENVTKRTRNIMYIGEGAEVLAAGEKGFAEARARLVGAWASMIEREKVSVGLAAIHQFKRPGVDLFWQRHGLATASAALKGGLAIGAAHFTEYLPDTDKSTLAARGVPKSHLNQGLHRSAHRLTPVDSWSVNTDHSQALIRVFTG